MAGDLKKEKGGLLMVLFVLKSLPQLIDVVRAHHFIDQGPFTAFFTAPIFFQGQHKELVLVFRQRLNHPGSSWRWELGARVV